MSVSIAAEWSELYNRFYRKQELYSMQWRNVDLSLHIVACARYGGPLALVRDSRQMMELGGLDSTQPRLQIYSGAGHLLSAFFWTKASVVQMGWTDEEVLVVVCEDGHIYQFDIHGRPQPPDIFLGTTVMEQGVADAVVWGEGVVVLTGTGQLLSVLDLSENMAIKLGSLPTQDTPHCLTVIEPQVSVSGGLEVLVAVGSTVFVVEGDSVTDQALAFGEVSHMAVSPNGGFLACFTTGGVLHVLSTDFSKNLSEFDSQSDARPQQLVWCGMDSVLVAWPEVLLMVGPYGDWVKYQYDDPYVVAPEADCVRIVSTSAHDVLARVPDATVSVFKIGSTAPGAMLFDALDHFDRQSAKADENIRGLGPALALAVESCVDAALSEFDRALQRQLLRAAAFGRAFLDEGVPKDRLRDACRALRVLNAVRAPDIGVPISYAQYQTLSLTVLVSRLINSHRHLLALRVSEYLGLPEEKVLEHWACTRISESLSLPDAEILDVLLEKLKSTPSISFAKVAAHAHSLGRRQLAAALLDHEPRASEQVPMLAALGEEEHALVKAIESGDTNLVYYTLFHLMREKPQTEFFRIIQGKPQARALFISYARQMEPEMLRAFFMSTGSPQGAADMLMAEAWRSAKEPQAAAGGVGGASGRKVGSAAGATVSAARLKMMDQAHDLYSKGKDCSLQAKAAEESAKLLRLQLELEASTGEALFVDTSVSDTIRTLLALGNQRAAQKVRVDMKVPDKRWYVLKIFALAHAKDFEGLEKFSKEKRPPVGFKPFVEACIDEGAAEEAVKYIPKVTDASDRAELYSRLGMDAEAATEASAAKDGELLGRLRSTLGQSAAAAALFDGLRDRLNLQG